jgi:hypothetical protein
MNQLYNFLEQILSYTEWTNNESKAAINNISDEINKTRPLVAKFKND